AINDRRPYEAPLLKTLGDQPHPAAIPIQALEIVAALAAKDEQVTAERITTNHLLCLRSQTVEPVAQVNRLTGKKDLRAGCQVDHIAFRIARSTRESAFSFTKASTQTRAPFSNTISIIPVSPLPAWRGCNRLGAGGASRGCLSSS